MINNFECQECGSSKVAEHDGFFVCRGCGLTIEDPVIQYNIGSFKTDKKGNAIQPHAILLNNTTIGTNSERKLKSTETNFTRLNKINCSIPFGEKDEARVIFNTLIAQSGIPVKLNLFMDVFNKIFPKIKKHSKSRNIRLFCTTIYYVVMNQQLTYVSLKTLLTEQNIDHREFFICIKAISVELPDIFKKRSETKHIMIAQHISKACDELKLPSEVSRIASKILIQYPGKLGYKSRIIAATAVSVAIRVLSLGNNIPLLQIANCLEVTASTVYSYLKNVKIEVLKKKYQEYLHNIELPINVVAPPHMIQENINTLEAENSELESESTANHIELDVSLPIIMIEKKSKTTKHRKTSNFISKNKDIFSKYVRVTQSKSFGFNTNQESSFGLERPLISSNNLANFTEFEFSPPIS